VKKYQKKRLTMLSVSLSMAFGAGANGAQLDEIIVTAQKRVQDIQDVPVAVTALSSAALESRGITETSDLMGAVPSLQVTTPYGRTQPNFSLRGISVANEFSATTASPVGVYVDEVYQSFRASHGQQLYDLEQVEVLRGPQGTLYGRNTTGGAVSFITRKPELNGTNGEIAIGYGNYATKTVDLAYEFTPVDGVFGVRIAGTWADGDGWQYNPVQERETGTTDTKAARIALRWNPSDKWDINFKGYASEDNPVAALAYAEGQLSNREDALGYSRFEPASFLGGRTLKDDEVASNSGGNYFSSSEGVALTIDYIINDSLSFKSITGYDEGEYRNSPFDCDGSPNDLCSLRYNSKSENFNQDFRLTYTTDKLNVIGGLYYGRDKVLTDNEIDFFGVLRPMLLDAGLPGSYFNPAIATDDSIASIPGFAAGLSGDDYCAPVDANPDGFLDARSLMALLTDIANDNSGGNGFGGEVSAACRAAGAPPFGPILGDQKYDIERPSTAIYVDATYDLNEKTRVAVGMRYTKDEVKYFNARTTLLDLAGENIVASTIPYSFPYDASLPPLSQTESSNELTGRVNLSHDFSDDIMGYVDYSRGYRSGSFNGLAYQGTNQVYYIDPEEIDAYEAGLKMRLLDNSLQLNLAAFFYDYANHQVTQVIGATTFTRSIDGDLYGGEAELTYQASDALRFDASLGLLRSEYSDNALDPSDPSSPTRSVADNPFPNAPDLTFTLGFDWDIMTTDKGTLTLHGDTSYMDKYYFDPFKDYGQVPCDQPAPGFKILQAGPSIACGNPSYWLINARMSYDTDKYSVSIWGKNLADEDYNTYGLNIDVFGLDYLNRGLPRTYGVELKMNF
jgi:iron complex outermembrane receptor protein